MEGPRWTRSPAGLVAVASIAKAKSLRDAGEGVREHSGLFARAPVHALVNQVEDSSSSLLESFEQTGVKDGRKGVLSRVLGVLEKVTTSHKKDFLAEAHEVENESRRHVDLCLQLRW